MNTYILAYAVFMTIWVLVQPVVFQTPHYDCKVAADIGFDDGYRQGINETVGMFRERGDSYE